jgi:hypothetical protein
MAKKSTSKTKRSAARGSLRDVVRCVRWTCGNCDRSGKVEIKMPVGLQTLAQRVMVAHNENYKGGCAAWIVEISI